MKILLASSEVHPYSKTGGLADMVAALAKSLANHGQETALVTPLYRGILNRFPEIQRLDWHIDEPIGSRKVQAKVWRHVPQPGLTVYFVDQSEFFDRDHLYQYNGEDYPDNAERFIFFSKCTVQLARYLSLQPQVVHVHDWQAGLVPAMILHLRRAGEWREAPATCLTIHNLAYQGLFPRSAYELTNLPWDYFGIDGAEYYGALNCLKAGIAFSDMITTVSPRYAREILTEAFGCGLDPILRQRQRSLVGILNGVDYSEWNTQNNRFLPQPFKFSRLAGKAAVKSRLQEELGLPQQADIPLFGSITRLVDQKGGDILLAALEEMLSAELQFVLLGSGDTRLESAFLSLAKRHPNKVAIRIGYDHALSHRIEAGSDFYLMPSRFEPCGLNQMYSLRYGTIPIVRATGGLDDSVLDPTEDALLPDGIKFYEFSARALAKAIRKALYLYSDDRLLRHFQKNAMSKDFSWDRTTDAYLQVYRKILDQKRE